MPMGVMKRCRLGVKRKGTLSLLENSGLLGVMAGADDESQHVRKNEREKGDSQGSMSEV